jgi:hypothetical protein
VAVRRDNELAAYEEPPVDELLELSNQLVEIKPEEIEVIGGDEPPEDLREAVEE